MPDYELRITNYELSNRRRAVIGLGSNLGDRSAYLKAAVSALSDLPETLLIARAKDYDTAPVDVPEAYTQMRFLNTAVLIETALSPEALLDRLQQIETDLHRVRTVRNGPRTIDLDLIAYQGETRTTERLTLPHPRAKERDFVLLPLRDLNVDIDRLTQGAPQ